MPNDTTGVLPRFDTPATQNDLSDPAMAAALKEEWSNSINRWTETAILGNPWSALNDHDRDFYFNPLTTDLTGGTSVPITWVAFPNRILLNYPSASNADQMAYAEGVHNDGTFGPPPPINGQNYGPGGPRGWQDEYCEWITTRDASNKITRIDFTCENPEYWFTLWRVSPAQVLSLYQTLVGPDVKLEDLYLLDDNNTPVIDRSTGLPAYNPFNKWNNQPSKDQPTGAVHLISPPNTLGAEIYLAAAATLLRDNPPGTPVTDSGKLIQCSQYGTAGRNSDPHIGASVNNLVIKGGLEVSLQNPVGLYIQMPDFSGYDLPFDANLPQGATVADCWQIIRGQKNLPGFETTFNFILHARFEIPQSWKDAGVSFGIEDITIQGDNIQYGAQITSTFQIGLRGLGVPTTKPAIKPQSCVGVNTKPFPVALLLQDLDLFNALSTSAAVTKVEQGTTTPNIVLQASSAMQGTSIQFVGAPGVSATVDHFQDEGQNGQLYLLSITVENDAPLGDRAILLVNPDGKQGPAAPGMLSVVPPGTLGRHAPAALLAQGGAVPVAKLAAAPAVLKSLKGLQAGKSRFHY